MKLGLLTNSVCPVVSEPSFTKNTSQDNLFRLPEFNTQ